MTPLDPPDNSPDSVSGSLPNVSLRDLIDSSLTSIFSLDRQYRYTSFNSAHASVMKKFYGADIRVGGNMLDYLSVDADREWARNRTDIALTGERCSSFFTVGDISSEHRFLEVFHNPIRDDSGAVVGVAVLSTDVSDRRRAEAAMARLNRELRAISACHKSIMRAEDEQSLLNDICRIICEQAGHRLVAICYAQHDENKTVLPVAWAGFDADFIANIKISWGEGEYSKGPTGTAIRTGEPVVVHDHNVDPRTMPWRGMAQRHGYLATLSLPLKNLDGATYGALVISTNEPDTFHDDEIRLLQELANDIGFGISVLRAREERKQAVEALEKSEAEYRRIVDTASEGIWTLGADATTTFVNSKLAELIGYPVDQIVGRPASDFMTEDDAARFAQSWAKRRTGKPETREQRLVHKDGDIRWTQLSTTPIFDADGEFQGAFAMLMDITSRKSDEVELERYRQRLEELVDLRTTELLQARNQAEAANHAKSRFLAQMSHELRTPLNSVLGFSELLRNDANLSAAQRETLDIIRKSGEHLLSLINDVLDVARIEAGKMTLSPEAFDLGEMIRDLVGMMRQRAEEKKLNLVFDQSSRFPRFVRADPARLRQVLINLIGNAVKYTDSGKVVWSAEVSEAAHESAHTLIFEIRDTGPGISAEDARRVFEPFVQVGSRSASTGSGLGLTITRQCVELMGGSIELDTTIGEGTVFRVAIPVEVVDVEDISGIGIKLGRVVGLAPGQPAFRILIVDDLPENVMLLQRLLVDIGFDVRVARDGAEAVEGFVTWQPNFIWMDRFMPVMDGLEATLAIRKLPGGADVKIVCLSASALNDQRDEALAAGMNDFVGKPYGSDEIYDCMAKHLSLQYTFLKPEAEPEQREADLQDVTTSLSAALRANLIEAITSLDPERIMREIDRISAVNPKVGHAFRLDAERFAYSRILEAVQST